CPETIDLAGAEIELVPAFSRELKLKRALQGARDDYDFTLIDCPPSLGLLTVNGLAASDDVIVPIQCEYYALEGLGQLLRNVSLVKTNLNPTLDMRGIVLTMYDARTKLAEQVEREVREHFGAKVYRTVVPRTVRISEAPSFGQPVTVFDASSRGALAYRELAKEVSRGASRRVGEGARSADPRGGRPLARGAWRTADLGHSSESAAAARALRRGGAGRAGRVDPRGRRAPARPRARVG